jgi:DNA-directed RNA polymerase specialized sigma24 family protein
MGCPAVRGASGERELVRAGAAGDPAAGAALWDAYGPRVFAFCQRVLGRADAAADAAQDAFLLAHASSGA